MIRKASILAALSAVSLTLVVLPVRSVAQGDYLIFPQVADGYFGDGSFYRSTLNIKHWHGSLPTNVCSLEFFGLDVDFGTGRSDLFDVTVPLGGYASIRTTADLPLATGYATLFCEAPVHAQMTYAAYDPSGTKTAEATVFPTWFERFVHRLIVDGRDDTRLGLAIANNSDSAHTYTLTLEDPSGFEVATGTTSVPARSNTAVFVADIVSPPPVPGETYLLEVRSDDFSYFSVLGLQYSGVVFSSVPSD
jgi:hypothetical protein